jgi:hypothetical protein
MLSELLGAIINEEAIIVASRDMANLDQLALSWQRDAHVLLVIREQGQSWIGLL